MSQQLTTPDLRALLDTHQRAAAAGRRHSALILRLADLAALHRADPATEECHDWPGATDAQGFARVRLAGRVYRADRLVLQLMDPLPFAFYGAPGSAVMSAPLGLMGSAVMSAPLGRVCRRPVCTNPYHFVPAQPGQRGHLATRAADVRTDRAAGLSLRALAAKYSTSVGSIRDVLAGRSYPGRPGADVLAPPRPPVQATDADQHPAQAAD